VNTRFASRLHWLKTPANAFETLAAQVLWPSLLMLVLAVGVEWTPADHWISDLFFDNARQTFPLNQHFLVKQVLHDWGRNIAYLIALITLLALTYSWVFKLPHWRAPLRFIFLSMLTSTATIALMKYTSTIHCPNNLLEYGGSFSSVELFDFSNSHQAAGKCWPSGHASTGFCLLALFYAARAYAPKWAGVSLCLALLPGFSFSLAQTARGVHCISHALWTALFIGSINIVLSFFLLPAKAPHL
jgi:membrane-associated PAP2 superfamily phosphatase